MLPEKNMYSLIVGNDALYRASKSSILTVFYIFTNFLLDGLISIAQWEEIADQRVSRREGEAKVCLSLLIEVFGSCWMLP